LKAVYDIRVSSAETIGAFNSGFDSGNLHRPTVGGGTPLLPLLDAAAQVEFESKN
jgi:hypothetical protein